MHVLTDSHGKRKDSGPGQPPMGYGPATAEITFRRLVGHLHALGPRPVAELLTELVGHDEQARSDVLHLLEKYAGLNPALVHALGGSGFPAPPIHEVRR